jgi:hypothetical protein
MAPLLLTALVGVGVKIATDLLSAGAKEMFRSGGPMASFASTLDQARSASAVPAAETAAKSGAPDLGFGDPSRLRAADASGLTATGRAQAAASYRRLEEIPQAL